MTAKTLPSSPRPAATLKPLRGVRVLSLALNLPGPAALMRLRAMGATCLKAEPPGPQGASGDPMGQYNPTAYATMHGGIKVLSVDLKTDKGQQQLHKALARTDVLLTSFRPSALLKLGLGWKALHKAYPALSVVAIVGAPGARAEEPGHDLTYLADAGLVTGLDLPATLFADMGGALMASEATLKAVLAQKTSGKGVFQEVALSDAAAWLALPRSWGLTQPKGAVGGAHAGYRVYPCKDGRVAVAALEPHFAASLCAAAGVTMNGMGTLFQPATHQAIATFLAGQTRKQLDALAVARDIPLHTLAR
ncbi:MULTISPECIES: CoA transferase [Hydrogenophaga]|jgi:crotonobetainyl-CoA:carnitine CoA-transferase CaiB-like acyl-CoA transferase|uniref:E-cinnamoyl-CoA:R-phenyllactate CoA transferase n=1 Tax=Hydrogenophaga pseudoflava TaxID=47421 RepID=A0A4P6WW62_HYDPS|nr:MULTISPECIES: CoA transferase [Hydrogenophaga]OPF64608.1 CoA-transferase [Hydrogenophaga sp. H7]QBM28192.1 E-cinnamoyl-CoA:R-phenyllactate CoA transferase [Hydrogenophaga pseudoflava]